MKPLFFTKTLIALAVAVAAAAAAMSQAQEAPIPPPSTDGALPANIVPGTPLADVVKMVQAGVDVSTIRSYIVNSQNAFNLDADKILYLKDIGLPSDLVNTMMDRDKVLYASTVTPSPAPPTTTQVESSVPDTVPPTEPVTVNYFNDTLSPYGTWVDVDGYGRCWRPTVVVYDTSWRPYCDRGHWVYTDCGWYWDSDYAWGAAFHYGRWFHHDRFGWCWYPDTVWAPSWVAWRSGGDYCGWAPLPPHAEFRPGFGFYYRGAGVAMDFDFGLRVDAFMFVGADHFCDRHPRSFCFDRTRSVQVFHQTTIVNNYVVNNRVIVNRGISVDRISGAMHHEVSPVHVSSLPNAGRQGWRGGVSSNPGGADLHGFGGVSQSGHGTGSFGHIGDHNDHPADHNADHNNPGFHPTPGQPAFDSTHGNNSFHPTSGGSASDIKPTYGNFDRTGNGINNRNGQVGALGTGGVGNTAVAGGNPGGNHPIGATHTVGQQNLKPANDYGQFGNSQSGHNDSMGERHVSPTPAPIVPATGNAWEHRSTGTGSASANNGFTPPPAGTHELPKYETKQYHGFNNADAGASHGAAQLQSQPHFAMPEQPRVEAHNYSAGPVQNHSAGPALSPAPHNSAPAGGSAEGTIRSGSGSTGGANNNNSNNSGGNDRNHQNH